MREYKTKLRPWLACLGMIMCAALVLACGLIDDGRPIGQPATDEATPQQTVIVKAVTSTTVPSPTFVPTQSAEQTATEESSPVPEETSPVPAETSPPEATPTLPEATPSPQPTLPSSEPTPLPSPTQELPTPEALPASGQVIYTGADGVSLRALPNGTKVGALLQGSQFIIRGPSSDVDGYRWWPVAIDEGWIVEGPIDPAQPRWVVPFQSTTLAAGGTATIAYSGVDGLNLRREPGLNGATIATLAQGSIVSITGPAQVIEETIWWPVRLQVGWMAEGTTEPGTPRWLSLNP